jgi:biotin transporter BioY
MHTTIGQTVILFPAGSLGYLAGVILSGWLFDHAAGHKIIATALVCMMLGFLVILWLLWLMGWLFEASGTDAAITAIMVDTLVTLALYRMLIFIVRDKIVEALV